MEKKEHFERINYVRDTCVDKDGNTKEVLVGAMVNISGVFQAGDEEELRKVALSYGKTWLSFMGEELAVEEPFELKELTHEQWEAKDDNIDYWEIERMKRVIARKTVKDKFLAIIETELLKYESYPVGSKAMAIIEALINQTNK